jgi:hypothetical protein
MRGFLATEYVQCIRRPDAEGANNEIQVRIKFKICNFVSSEFEVMKYTTDCVLDYLGRLLQLQSQMRWEMANR